MIENRDSSIAAVFVGQGSIHAGMGKGIFDAYRSQVIELYEAGSEVVGVDMVQVCNEDPNGLLGSDSIAQPALVIVELAEYRVAEEEIGLKPGHVAGHSLGELSAVSASGLLDFVQTIKLAKVRGEAMEEASIEKPGSMAAVLGLPEDRIGEICERFGVYIANENSDVQIVVSGLRDRVQRVAQYINGLKNQGERVKFQLLDSIHMASHCPLMDPARPILRSFLDGIDIKWPPKVPLISNSTAQYPLNEETLKDNLADQVVKKVKWRKSILEVVKNGADVFYVVGPGNFMAGAIQRIDPSAVVRNVNDLLLNR